MAATITLSLSSAPTDQGVYTINVAHTNQPNAYAAFNLVTVNSESGASQSLRITSGSSGVVTNDAGLITKFTWTNPTEDNTFVMYVQGVFIGNAHPSVYSNEIAIQNAIYNSAPVLVDATGSDIKNKISLFVNVTLNNDDIFADASQLLFTIYRPRPTISRRANNSLGEMAHIVKALADVDESRITQGGSTTTYLIEITEDDLEGITIGAGTNQVNGLVEDLEYRMFASLANEGASSKSANSNTVIGKYAPNKINAPIIQSVQKVLNEDNKLTIKYKLPTDIVALAAVGVSPLEYTFTLGSASYATYTLSGDNWVVSLDTSNILVTVSHSAIGQADASGNYQVLVTNSRLPGTTVTHIGSTSKSTDGHPYTYGPTAVWNGSILMFDYVRNVSTSGAFAGVADPSFNRVTLPTITCIRGTRDISGNGLVLQSSVNNASLSDFNNFSTVLSGAGGDGSSRQFNTTVQFSDLPGNNGDTIKLNARVKDVSNNVSDTSANIVFIKQARPDAPASISVLSGLGTGKFTVSTIKGENGNGVGSITDASCGLVSQYWWYQVDSSGDAVVPAVNSNGWLAPQDNVITTGLAAGTYFKVKARYVVNNMNTVGQTYTSLETTSTRTTVVGEAEPASALTFIANEDITASAVKAKFSFKPAQTGIKTTSFKLTFSVNGGSDITFSDLSVNDPSGAAITRTFNVSVFPATVNIPQIDSSDNIVVNLGAGAFTWGDSVNVKVFSKAVGASEYPSNAASLTFIPYKQSVLNEVSFDTDASGYDVAMLSITPNGSPLQSALIYSILAAPSPDSGMASHVPMDTMAFELAGNASGASQGTNVITRPNPGNVNVNLGSATSNSNLALIRSAVLTGTTTTGNSSNVNSMTLTLTYTQKQLTNGVHTGLAGLLAVLAGNTMPSGAANHFWNLASNQA